MRGAITRLATSEYGGNACGKYRFGNVLSCLCRADIDEQLREHDQRRGRRQLGLEPDLVGPDIDHPLKCPFRPSAAIYASLTSSSVLARASAVSKLTAVHPPCKPVHLAMPSGPCPEAPTRLGYGFSEDCRPTSH